MIVGLTGGIGSGKSAVAQLFAVMGAVVYDSDKRAKDMYLDASVKKEVISLLGNEVYNADGSLNKLFVSGKIFTDKELIRKINGIIHPAVGKDFKEFVKQHPSKIIIKETALLFEADLLSSMDKIVLVTAPEDLKIKRIQQRDKLNTEQIQERFKNQWPDSEKINKSHFVIVNDEKKGLIPQVLDIYKQLSHA